jgi:nicotinamide mononucleotide adenylyltransferase
MANWQKSSTRQAPKTKAELRQMLTDAVRNTQPSLERTRLVKARKIADGAARVDQAPEVIPPVR